MADTPPPFNFEAYLPEAQGYAIISRGAFGFRYGPYPITELGQIMGKSVDENLPVFISIDCGGQPFDYELARNMRGFPHEEEDCPGHVSDPDVDPKVCKLCGTHVDSLRPDPDTEGAA